MKIEEAKAILAARAIERHPGKLITYCGTRTNWDDCFTIIDLKNKKELIFWYNVDKGTFNEILTLNKEK